MTIRAFCIFGKEGRLERYAGFSPEIREAYGVNLHNFNHGEATRVYSKNKNGTRLKYLVDNEGFKWHSLEYALGFELGDGKVERLLAQMSDDEALGYISNIMTLSDITKPIKEYLSKGRVISNKDHKEGYDSEDVKTRKLIREPLKHKYVEQQDIYGITRVYKTPVGNTKIVGKTRRIPAKTKSLVNHLGNTFDYYANGHYNTAYYYDYSSCWAAQLAKYGVYITEKYLLTKSQAIEDYKNCNRRTFSIFSVKLEANIKQEYRHRNELLANLIKEHNFEGCDSIYYVGRLDSLAYEQITKVSENIKLEVIDTPGNIWAKISAQKNEVRQHIQDMFELRATHPEIKQLLVIMLGMLGQINPTKELVENPDGTTQEIVTGKPIKSNAILQYAFYQARAKFDMFEDVINMPEGNVLYARCDSLLVKEPIRTIKAGLKKLGKLHYEGCYTADIWNNHAVRLRDKVTGETSIKASGITEEVQRVYAGLDIYDGAIIPTLQAGKFARARLVYNRQNGVTPERPHKQIPEIPTQNISDYKTMQIIDDTAFIYGNNKMECGCIVRKEGAPLYNSLSSQVFKIECVKHGGATLFRRLF